MERCPSPTDPATFTSKEVAAIFRDLTVSMLQDLDKRGLIRPTYYSSSSASSGLMTRDERDRLNDAGGTTSSPSAPHRLYTYGDLLWIRIFLRVKVLFKRAAVPNAARRAAEAVSRIRERTGDRCPPSWRLVLFGSDVFLLTDDDRVESLTQPGQLGFVQWFETIDAEIKGRISALVAHKKIRDVRGDRDIADELVAVS